jgi:probable phosphoglycerate mutase
MKFYLVRHGQSEANVTKTIAGQSATPLTDLGRKQARALGLRLKEMKIKFDVVYSSDIPRASETASIICHELGITDIVHDIRLREGDAGVLTDRQTESLTKDERNFWDSMLIDHDKKPEGGESVNEQYRRTSDAFLEIVESHPEDSAILIIGHGGTLYHILIRTLELLPPKLDEWFGNCMLNIAERNSSDNSWTLTMFNNKSRI